MSLRVKTDSSTWSSVVGAYVKTGASSWSTVKQAYVKTSGGWKQFFINVLDTFFRTTTGGLGTSDNGFSWNALFGTWYSNGNLAASDDTATTTDAAALAYVEVGNANAIVTASLGVGVGPAFWVTPSNGWWGVISYSDQTSSSYSYSYPCGTYACNPQPIYNYVCQSCPVYCPGASYYTGSRSACNCNWNGLSGLCQCPSYICPPYYQPCNCSYQYAGTAYSSCTSYCVASGTNTSTNYYIQIIQSTGGTGYSVVSTTQLNSQPASIRVTTSGTTATVQAYSDSAAVNALGSPVTATNSTSYFGTKHGIVKSYSPYGQTSSIFSFSAEA